MRGASLTFRHVPGGTVAWVSGYVDATCSASFAQQLAAAHTSAHEPLVLDLSALTFFDCSGLGVLIRIHTALDPDDGGLHLAAATGKVGRLLDISGVGALLNLHESLDEALAAAGLRQLPH